MGQSENHSSWVLWHPYQGLWNWDLVNAIKKIVPIRPINKLIIAMIVLLDSSFLWVRALARRVAYLGIGRIFSRARVPDNVQILYLDLGTHKEGAELAWMAKSILPKMCKHFEALGFEASKASFDEAAAKLTGIKNLRLFHLALCHVVPDGGKLRLYKDDKVGIGDSLFRPSDTYEEVDAKRLSDLLRDEQITLDNKIVLLRMNIEGAEFEVLQDICENRLNENIIGYYGMWDDVSKVNQDGTDDFRSFLGKNNIHNFTFNGRDLNWTIRKWCVEYDLNTSVLRGIRRTAKDVA